MTSLANHLFKSDFFLHLHSRSAAIILDEYSSLLHQLIASLTPLLRLFRFHFGLVSAFSLASSCGLHRGEEEIKNSGVIKVLKNANLLASSCPALAHLSVSACKLRAFQWQPRRNTEHKHFRRSEDFAVHRINKTKCRLEAVMLTSSPNQHFVISAMHVLPCNRHRRNFRDLHYANDTSCCRTHTLAAHSIETQRQSFVSDDNLQVKY